MKLIDTSCLILFLEFLQEYAFLITFSEIGEVMIITPQVEKEYNSKNVQSDNINYNLTKLIDNDIIIKEDCEIFDLFKNKYFYLGKGEQSILSLGLKYKAQNKKYFCVLDDKKARKVASEMGLHIKGSIGLLHILKRKGLIEKPKEVIEKIRNSPFRVSDDILEGLDA